MRRRRWRGGEGHVEVNGVHLAIPELTALSIYVANSPAYTHLPPALGTDAGLAIDAVYVELSLCTREPQVAPGLLGQPLTLAEALDRRRDRRRARRLSIGSLLQAPQDRYALILGDPGSGKSSLLRRIALEVARGQHQNWFLPLLLPLPTWWAACQRAGHIMPLAEFALASLRYETGVTRLPPAEQVAGAERSLLDAMLALFAALAVDRTGVLFLFDGLDELGGAGGMEAASALRGLGIAFGVLVTSRPAGVPGAMEEDVRYELMELERDGSEALVKQWFAAAASSSGRESASAALLRQIDANPRLAEMARNPFLLTLLCHLQARQMGGDLPIRRSGVYARILDLAREQARHRSQDKTCLAPVVVARLERFCAWLYRGAPRCPRNLFTEADWEAFEPPAPALETSVMPARLLTRWEEHGDYHFIHLTFHEYLVANALIDSVEIALENCFNPVFRMPLRFLGTLLWERDRRQDFIRLLRTFIDPPDLLGRTWIEAAWILFDAGIQDTQELLGQDLRESLWQIWEEHRPFVHHAAGEALCVLDPHWTLARISEQLSDRGEQRTRRGPHLRRRVRDDEQADQLVRRIGLLAEVHLADSEDLLVRLFLEARDEIAYAAAQALAEVGGSRVRARLCEAATGQAGINRFCRFASSACHPDCLPPLHGALDRYGEATDLNIISALAITPDAKSIAPILGWFERSPRARLEVAAETIAGIAGDIRDPSVRDAVGEWFTRVARDPLFTGKLRATVLPQRIRAGLSNAKEIVAFLRDPVTRALTLGILHDEGSAGRSFEPEVLKVVARLASTERKAAAFEALCELELGRSLRGDSPVCLPALRSGLDSRSVERRRAAASILGTLGDDKSVDRLLALALDRRQHIAVRHTAASSLGMLDAARRHLDRIESLLADPDLASAVADALCRWDIGRIGRYLDHRAIRDALARLGAKDGPLVFPDGWRDRQGVHHPWSTGPSASTARSRSRHARRSQ